MIDCDDVCALQHDYEEFIQENREQNIQSAEIGVFNGKTYVFATVDGKPMIYIEEDGMEDQVIMEDEHGEQ